MQEKIFYVFITFCLAFFSACESPDVAETDAPHETIAAADLIRQADELFKGRGDIGKLREAVALLERAPRRREKLRSRLEARAV